jgi:hypothetical protein
MRIVPNNIIIKNARAQTSHLHLSLLLQLYQVEQLQSEEKSIASGNKKEGRRGAAETSRKI